MFKKLKKNRKNTKNIFSSRFFQISLFLSIIFLALSVLLPLWRLFPDIKDLTIVPLHYNIHLGTDLLGPWWKIFTFPIFGGMIFLINFLTAILLWSRDKTLSYFFVTTAVLCEIFVFISMIFVVLLNLTYV